MHRSVPLDLNCHILTAHLMILSDIFVHGSVHENAHVSAFQF